MVPILIMFAVAASGNVASTIAVSMIVPIGYALANGLFDFGVRWGVKGRNKGPLLMWTNDDESETWQQYTGDVEKLATLHKNGRHVAYVERSVRPQEANPYSLGLNLAFGALAVDLAAIVANAVASIYLVYALFSHSIIVLIVALLIFLNQTAKPNEILFIRLTAGAAVLLGALAVMIAFLVILGSGK